MKKLLNIGLFLMLFMISIVTNAQEVIDHLIEYKIRPTVQGIGLATTNDAGGGVGSVYQASYNPFITSYAASNNIALTNGDLQVVNLTGQGSSIIYLPNAPTNQFHVLTLQCEPSTNSLTFATNGLVTVSLDPDFVLPANQRTLCEFVKMYNSDTWEGTIVGMGLAPFTLAFYSVYSNAFATILTVSPSNGANQAYYPTNATTISPLSFEANNLGYQMMLTIDSEYAVTFTNCTLAAGCYVTNNGVTAVLFDRWSGTSNWFVHTINP